MCDIDIFEVHMIAKVAAVIEIVFGFRKFIAFNAVLLVAILFRLSAHIDGSQFVELMKNVTISFFTVNGVEHLTDTLKKYFVNKKE